MDWPVASANATPQIRRPSSEKRSQRPLTACTRVGPNRHASRSQSQHVDSITGRFTFPLPAHREGGFKTQDISALNDGRHNNDKLDTFRTPNRDPEFSARNPPPQADTEWVVHGLDRKWFYTFQERLLASLRIEVKEEGLKLRQSVNKSIQEIKHELLVDMCTKQHNPAQAVSRILAAAWETIDEVRQAKGEFNNSEVLRAIREHSRVDLTEVLVSIEDVKQRLDCHRATSNVEVGLETSLAEIHSELSTVRKKLDLSPILKGVNVVGKSRRVDVAGSPAPPGKPAFSPGVSMTFSDSAAEQSAGAFSCQSVCSADICSMLRTVSGAVADRKEQLLQGIGGSDKGTLAEAALGEVKEEFERAAATLREEGLRLRKTLCAAGDRSNQGIGLLRGELLDAVHGCRQLLENLRCENCEGAHQLLESLGDIRQAMERSNCQEVLNLLRKEAGQLTTSHLRLAEVLATVQDHRAQSERDLMEGLAAVRDLRSSAKVDMHPVLQGFQQTDTKLSKMCVEILVKLEEQHLKVLDALKKFSLARSGLFQYDGSSKHRAA